MANIRLVPDYGRVFKAPPMKYSGAGQQFGRNFVKHHFSSQWFTYNANQRVVRAWLDDAAKNDLQRSGETRKAWLMRIVIPKVEESLKAKAERRIDEKIHIQDLAFEGTGMRFSWEVLSTVRKLVEVIKARRYNNNKRVREQVVLDVTAAAEEVESNSDVAMVAIDKDVEDERLVMDELKQDNVHTMMSMLCKEIRFLNKYIPDRKRFDKYTHKSNREKIAMLAKYYREKRSAAASSSCN